MSRQTFRRYRAMSIESRDALNGLKEAFAGEEAIVLGSGASLADTDLDALSGRAVIYLNNTVRLHDRIRPARALVALSDHLRAIELRPDIEARGLTCVATTDKIFTPGVDPDVFAAPFLFVMPKIADWPKGGRCVAPQFGFSDDLGRGVYLGRSVVFPAIQIAWCLGARRIALVGVDMTLGARPAYFDPAVRANWGAFDYARDGRPHFLAMAAAIAERGGRLTNCSTGGALDALAWEPSRFARAEGGEPT